MLNFISLIAVYLITGFFSGFLSLIALSLLDMFNLEVFVSHFFIIEIVEEVIKFIVIIFLANLFFNENKNKFFLIFYSVFFGVGFGLFELTLVALSSKNSFSFLNIFAEIFIHSLTSFVLSLAIILNYPKKNPIYSSVSIVFAIFIHIVYNLFALNLK